MYMYWVNHSRALIQYKDILKLNEGSILDDMDGLMQERRSSIANTLEVPDLNIVEDTLYILFLYVLFFCQNADFADWLSIH